MTNDRGARREGPARRPTLSAVAALAGVSPSTVSRVVRGEVPVSGERARAVQDAIERLGYVPNFAARQLVTDRADAVGVVIPEDQTHVFGEPFFTRLIQGVAAGLAATPFRFVLVVGRCADDRQWLEQYVRGRHIDGVMLLAPQRGDPLGQTLQASGVPVVFIGRPFGLSGARYLDADNAGGTRRAVHHLYERGRRHIAMVTGVRTMRSSHDRHQGYRRGLADVGLRPDGALVVESDYTTEGAARATARLLERGVPVDAVVAASDTVAYGVLRALRAAGRRVPDDVAVVGFGDDPSSGEIDPPLTTVAQPVEKMGGELARLVVAAVNGEERPRRVVLPTELVVRRTT
ncbi:LacI family DNA-binding transcriptional regulator [Streptomyces sp. NPDC006134]|uniref:LacI family DNA-binding transcriptional regulator n=1 Tax=Streptomyces sp. NPDC006134 TaxID=3154467 RepID=UPI0033F9D811